MDEPKDEPMTYRMSVVLVVYFVTLSVLFIYLIINSWPTSDITPTQNMSDSSTLNIFSLNFSVSTEIRLIWIVALSGGLGSILHGLSSLVQYRAYSQLTKNWTLWYFARPFIGSTLALIVYFTVRGGFLTVSANAESMNIYGIAAVSGLSGLFTEPMMRKLRDALDALFGIKKDVKVPDDKEENNKKKER